MVPPKQYSVRMDGQHEQMPTDSKLNSSNQQQEPANWINGIITCLKPVWSFIGRAALEEKLRGYYLMQSIIQLFSFVTFGATVLCRPDQLNQGRCSVTYQPMHYLLSSTNLH